MMATVAVSPDGQRVAFTLGFPDAPPQVFVRPLDALTPTAVRGSEMGWGPFWSPDGRQIAFWGLRGLQKVDLAGGFPQLICRDCRRGGGATEHGATWGTADVIVFSEQGRLYRVPASGGEPEPLGELAAGETGRFWPQFLPDGRHYIYLSLASRREDDGIYVGALGTDLRKRIVAAEHTAAYSPPGYLLYIKEKVLVAQPFDASRLEVSGEPVSVLEEEVARLAGTTLAAPAFFSVSTNGVLAWRPATGDHRQLTWFDRTGRKIGMIGEAARQVLDDLSPDEKTAAVCRAESPTNRDIWLLDVASGAGRRLTFDPHDDCGATFSPDGTSIVFFSDRRGVRELYRKPVDGSGDDELLLASKDFGLNPEDWSADSRFVIYKVGRPGHGVDVFVLPLSPGEGGSPIPFLVSQADESFSTLSPSGRHMTYQSTESGKPHVYVREVAASGRPGPGRWQVSARIGLFPMWRPDGRELFFFEPPWLMAVEVAADGPVFAAGPSKPLGIQVSESGGPRYYVTRDGQRFLFATPVTPSEPIRVLVNWLPAGR
jgi:Tol biopolymer transport system component